MASLNSSQGLCLGWVTMRLPTGAEIAIVPPHIHITWEEPFSAALYMMNKCPRMQSMYEHFNAGHLNCSSGSKSD